mmetsp:Transcript_108089/g.304468  ORF Transcript_108089/g.304468 Transcript_108089/m.304468 type:complete len:237 (+) Transcript_108089:90-800(+)
MQRNLPPIDSLRDVRPPTGMDVVDRENPYENSWGILKAIKAEVRELQAALRAEQRLRETEVNGLRNEVKDLRSELEKEKQERKAEMQRQIDPVNGACASLKEDLRKAKAAREKQIQDLNDAMEDERRDRTDDVARLTERILAEENTRTAVTNELGKGLAETRRSLDASYTDARQSIRNLTQDMKMVGDHLLRVNVTWQGFRGHEMSAVNPKSPTATTTSPLSNTVPMSGHSTWAAS